VRSGSWGVNVARSCTLRPTVNLSVVTDPVHPVRSRSAASMNPMMSLSLFTAAKRLPQSSPDVSRPITTNRLGPSTVCSTVYLRAVFSVTQSVRRGGHHTDMSNDPLQDARIENRVSFWSICEGEPIHQHRLVELLLAGRRIRSAPLTSERHGRVQSHRVLGQEPAICCYHAPVSLTIAERFHHRDNPM
jgi:hypothetical protein